MIKKSCAAEILLSALGLIACSAGGAPAPTPIPAGLVPGAASMNGSPTSIIPIRTPADLALSGRLLFVQGKAGIAVLDLATGQVSNLFQPPTDGLVSAVSLSPDGQWIVMSYSPPPEPDKPQLGYTRLFVMPADGSAALEPLLQPADETGLLYTLPSWSPDGRLVYYACFSPQDAGDQASGFSIQRVAYPGGHPEKVIADAFQPRLSEDGSMLAYVALTDPTTPINELYLAGADGSDPRKLVPGDDSLWTIDAPVFSPDGRAIVFSGVTNQPQASTSWLDRLLGIRVAQAHNVPSDLWMVPTAGGEPANLAHLNTIGLYPAFSPDGHYIAFVSLTGIYVMAPDGSQLAQISALGGAGTLQWNP